MFSYQTPWGRNSCMLSCMLIVLGCHTNSFEDNECGLTYLFPNKILQVASWMHGLLHCHLCDEIFGDLNHHLKRTALK